MKKRVRFVLPTVGFCVVPVCDEDNMHEFGLYNRKDKLIHTSYFASMERACEKASIEYPKKEYTVKDHTEKTLIDLAITYRRNIKKLHPAFNITDIILDMSEYYKEVNYTFIPFTHKGVKWEYREHNGKEWVRKILIA